MKKYVLFDCDNTMGLPHQEIDDGLTLLYLLGRSDIKLLGITTTFGNGSIEAVYTATTTLVQNLGCDDIAVHKGAGHHQQGPTDAAHFLVEQVAARPGEISLLATGPLGNLRAAAALDPHFFKNLKQIVCMGGITQTLYIGNQEIAELNFSCDPEGAYATLNAPCPVTVMNAHICLQAPFRQRDLARLSHWPPTLQYRVEHWLETFGNAFNIAEFYLWDLLPAVYISYPTLFEKHTAHIQSSVSDLARGQLMLNDVGPGMLINAPTHILNPERFKNILFETWGNIP